MAKPLFLFAPGAGAPSTSSWMLRFGEGLRALGTVVTFDYPYQTNGRKLPDRLPTLLKAHNEALLAARQEHQGPVVLVGKSMGSRVGCHVSLTHSVDALICFGYPLQSAGKNPKLRDQVLRSLTTPILFVQGTRDPLCPIDMLQPLLSQLQAPRQLHIVESGDHSLQATRRWLAQHHSTQAQVEASILASVQAFISEYTSVSD